MKMTLELILVCMISLFSCNRTNSLRNNNNENDNKNIELPYFVDLEKNLDKIKSVPISNIGKELEYIPLETTPKSLIGRRIYEIQFSDTYIFINDGYKILQFSKDGKFIRQVGAIGRGPGEYINTTMGFCIDEIRNKVMINAWGIPNVLEYDFDGHYIRTFKKDFQSPEQLLVNDTNSIVFRLGNSKDQRYGLIITDMRGISKTKIKNKLIRVSRGGLSVRTTPFYIFNNKLHFMEYGIDTLSILKDSILEPYAIFNLGNMKMDPDISLVRNRSIDTAILERLKQKLRIQDILENGQNLFVTLRFGLSDSTKLCVYKKQTDETVFLEDNGFLNDVDGGLTFWPKFIYKDSILIDYVEGYVFKEQINSGNQEEKMKIFGDKYTGLKNLANAVDELSNPVLITLKSK